MKHQDGALKGFMRLAIRCSSLNISTSEGVHNSALFPPYHRIPGLAIFYLFVLRHNYHKSLSKETQEKWSILARQLLFFICLFVYLLVVYRIHYFIWYFQFPPLYANYTVYFPFIRVSVLEIEFPNKTAPFI